ncbi:hypothetical protein CMV_027767 [Castanea mollissima]|uniref:MYB-CC type transcription factor LHEQLE-containing domain-containing protein n=1 Tax=Castanea mollissima TaxID=60419 RepID=A0A8J4Q9S6_9ROSI|nr:hypothetical protein CMV_027767 [Castanea mollissima]
MTRPHYNSCIVSTSPSPTSLLNAKSMGSEHLKHPLSREKYRTTLSGAESVDEMPKRRASADGNPQLHVKIMQIQETLQLQLEVEKRLHEQLEETLQLQLEVEKRLHEQIEVQQNLQIMIEEQWRQIKMMSHVQVDKKY